MSIYEAIVEMEKRGDTGSLCTLIESHGSVPRHAGSKMLVFPDGQISGSVGGGELENRVIKEALEALQEGRARRVSYNMSNPKKGDPGICGGQVEVLIEPILPRPLVVIVGGGHVGKATAHLAKWLGFRVAVTDDRPEFCTKDAVPDGDLFFPIPLEELPGQLKISPQSYLILTTRAVAVDVAGLPALLDTPAEYIGVIGSKRRWIMTRKGLEAAGVPEEKIKRIRSPMGLEIGAETPEEIAVSIMAEVLMVRNQGSGNTMTMV